MISANPAVQSRPALVNPEHGQKHGEEHGPTHKNNNLLSHPQLWRAGQLNRQHTHALASGYASLDAQLPGGGWPRAGLAEVLHEQPGLGELRLLAPALADLSQDENRWIAWINPPAIPYAPALGRFGIRSDRMLMIHPKTHEDALWAAEQSARSGTCSAVLIWLDDSKLRHSQTRRLQLAARQGNALACLFRHSNAAGHASGAELRLRLHGSQAPARSTGHTDAHSTGSYSNMQVDVLKRRGGWAVDNIAVELVGDDPIRRLQDIQQQLSLWQQTKQQHRPKMVPRKTAVLASAATELANPALTTAVNSGAVQHSQPLH